MNHAFISLLNSQAEAVMMSDRKIAILAVIAAAILSSAAAAVSKKGLEEIPPLSFTFIRLAVASICILPFFIHLKGHKISKIKELVPVSLFATGNIFFFILGLLFTSANVASIIYAAVPLLAAIILYIFFRQKISSSKQVGISIGFLGVVIITLIPFFDKVGLFSGNFFGNFLLAIAVICYAFYLVYSKKVQEKYSPLIITSSSIFLSTLIIAPFFIWDFFNSFGWWIHIGWWGIFSVLYVAIAISIGSYLLNQYSVKHGGAVLTGTMFYIMPIFGFVINFLLLGETLTPVFIFGSVLALLGTYLVVRK